jgi:hypothetical protein
LENARYKYVSFPSQAVWWVCVKLAACLSRQESRFLLRDHTADTLPLPAAPACHGFANATCRLSQGGSELDSVDRDDCSRHLQAELFTPALRSRISKNRRPSGSVEWRWTRGAPSLDSSRARMRIRHRRKWIGLPVGNCLIW